jgi:type IV secretory pathway VirB2 component (pilin)
MLTLVRRVLLCAAVSVALAHASPAHATLAVPMPAEDLAADADAIVTGHVTHIISHWDPHLAQIVTTIAS